MKRNYPTGVDLLDWSTVQQHVDALLAADLTAANTREWLQSWSDLFSLVEEETAQVYRDITENTADKAADARFKHFVQDILPAASRAEQALKLKWLEVDDYEATAETAALLKRFRAEVEIFHDENVPLISELRLLDKRYDEIIGGLSIQWEGEKTIPQAEVLLSSPDRIKREKVWRLALDGYLAHRSELDDLFLQMLPLRRKLAENAGFEDFRGYQWLSMGRFDYTPDDCFTFQDAIEHEVVPLATEIYRTLAAELDLDSFRPWEAGVNSPQLPTVDPYDSPLTPFASADELEETSSAIFRQVDPAFGHYFTAMRNGYLDLSSRPNKAPGGYCNAFPASGQPYIFINAAGSHDNVTTMLHEGGHAFHFAEAYRNQSLLWNYQPPLEFAEVASMSMELLSSPYWTQDQGGFYTEADFHRALTQELYGTVLFFPYMAVMDRIQHWLYVDAPKEIDASDIDRKWSELWDRFLPGIDYSGLQAEKETGWHRKGHIFGIPFYYVEYGLAQLGALQVWRNSLHDYPKAVAAYRRALAAGYTKPLPDLFAAAGARFAFDRETVAELMTLIRGQLEAIAA